MAKHKAPKVPKFFRATAALRLAPIIAEQMIEKFAEREAETFVHFIENQAPIAFEVTPLSEKWAAFKKKHGLDKRTMIATHNYIKHIRVHHEHEPRYQEWKIGFDEGDRAIDPITKKHTPFPLNLLAAVHEYGSAKANIPARPHWRDFFYNVLIVDAEELPEKIVKKVMRGV